jgi:hypothetical protein
MEVKFYWIYARLMRYSQVIIELIGHTFSPEEL